MWPGTESNYQLEELMNKEVKKNKIPVLHVLPGNPIAIVSFISYQMRPTYSYRYIILAFLPPAYHCTKVMN